jgi:hypothetical protein
MFASIWYTELKISGWDAVISARSFLERLSTEWYLRRNAAVIFLGTRFVSSNFKLSWTAKL